MAWCSTIMNKVVLSVHVQALGENKFSLLWTNAQECMGHMVVACSVL